ASNGVRVWEVSSGRVAADLEAGRCFALRFDADGSHLVTYGDAGLVRWPLRSDPDRSRGGRLGAPEKLCGPVAPGWTRACWWGGGGGLLGVGTLTEPRCFLVKVGRPAEPVVLRGAGSDVVAISPDGRWAVTGGDPGSPAQVWEVTGRRICDLSRS